MQLNTSCKKNDADLTYILICDSSYSSNKMFLLQEVLTRKQPPGIPKTQGANNLYQYESKLSTQLI
jgi:hypothetical protein